MDINLSNYLNMQFPELYKKERNGQSHGTGFSCDNGWFNILLSLSYSISNILEDRKKTNIMLQNVKEDILNNNEKDYPYWLKDYILKNGNKDLLNHPKFNEPEETDKIVVVQVKEKFGVLCYYVDRSDKVINEVIENASSLSSMTCETCGSPGRTRRGSWIRVLCDDHAKEGGYVELPERKIGDKIYYISKNGKGVGSIEKINDNSYTLVNNIDDIKNPIKEFKRTEVVKIVTKQITYYMEKE